MLCVRESVSVHLQPIAHNFTYLLNHISSATSPTIAWPLSALFPPFFLRFNQPQLTVHVHRAAIPTTRLQVFK